MSMEECVRLAVENNLEIKIEEHNPRIERFRLDGSYAYYEPVFEITGIHSKRTETEGDISTGTALFANTTESDTLNSGIRGALPTGLTYDIGGDFAHRTGVNVGGNFDTWDSDIAISLRQPLLKNFWTDAGRTDIEISKRSLRMSQHALEQRVLDTVRNVQRGYYELIFAIENVKVQEKALELARQQLAETKKKIEIGTLPQLDEKQVESQVASRQASLISAQRQRVTDGNVLKGLVSSDYSQWQPVLIEPAEKLVAVPERLDLSESWGNGLTLRPDFNQLKTEVERQGLVVRFNRNQFLPSLDLVGSYGRSGLVQSNSSFGGTLDEITGGVNPAWSVGVVVSVPLGFRSERSALRAAREQQSQLQARVTQKHQDIIIRIENTLVTVKANFEAVQATREARVFAEAALDAEQKKFEAGKSTSFLVLEKQNDLTAARGAEIRALANYNQSLVDAAYEDGTLLQKNKVTVNVK